MIQIQKSKSLGSKLLLAAAALMLIMGVIMPIIRASLAHADDTNGVLEFTSPTDKTVQAEGQQAITDLALTGDVSGDVHVNLFVEDGTLAFGASTDLTFAGPTSGNNLQFSGTKAAINAALATLQYTAPSSAGTVKVEALINDTSGGVFWSDNGHAYKVVTTPGINWTDARAAAEAQTFGGVSGYLATITSQAEHEFVLTRINQDGWIGASDAAVEGAWRWVTGPEGQMDSGNGLLFWQGDGNTGAVVSGEYHNWNRTSTTAKEPNNAAGNEDCAQIRFSSTPAGQWNDLPCGTTLPNYVVEFGAAGSLPEVVNTSFNIAVTPAPATNPVITSTTPATNASNVAVGAPLSFTFDKLTYGSEGNLKLHNETDGTSQDILHQEGWSDISIAGNTVTVNWRSGLALQPCKTYYMEIPGNVFWYNDAVTTTYYAGMNSPYTWRFSTQCSSPSGYNPDATAMHGQVINKTTGQPIPHAEVNIFCGEGGGVVVQADGSGAYSFTMGQLYDAIDSSCAFAMGVSMHASAEDYDRGEEEWSGDRDDDGDEEWQDYIARNFGGQKFNFHLVGDGSSSGNENNGEPTNTRTFANTVTGADTTVELGSNCTVSDAAALAKGSTKDAGYEYKSGLVSFNAQCSGGSTVVKIYQYGVDASSVVLRKHNPATGAYFTVEGATITSQTVGGKRTAVATYTLVDNGPLDLDKRTGHITDPVGLGSLVVGSPNTGLKRTTPQP